MKVETFEIVKAKIIENGFTIVDSNYSDGAFGSWYVTINSTPCRRVVWDGKESWLLVEQETDREFNGSKVWDSLCLLREANDSSIQDGLSALFQCEQSRE